MKNRPKLENYHDIDLLSMPPIHKSAKDQYLMDLEKYCDWLENALDKACFKLYCLSYDEKTGNVIVSDNWKEWCLKNE